MFAYVRIAVAMGDMDGRPEALHTEKKSFVPGAYVLEIQPDRIVALISGATQGVGAAIAETAARSGDGGLPIAGRDAAPIDLAAPMIVAIVDQRQMGRRSEVVKVTGRTM